ncbi:MAG TPA: hypothetical protein VFV63_05995, partial [Ilumatobacteraceae bacterium]|nr:hypothetical protein [Ilumatobacteraceae bacterium]
GRLAATAGDAARIARQGSTDGAGVVGVVVSPTLPDLGADVVVDARLAKRNIDTSIDDAPLVIGLGPGASQPASTATRWWRRCVRCAPRSPA